MIENFEFVNPNDRHSEDEENRYVLGSVEGEGEEKVEEMTIAKLEEIYSGMEDGPEKEDLGKKIEQLKSEETAE